MLRTVIATSIVFAVACGSKADAPPAPIGPTYSPVIANGLRAVAPDCKTTKTGSSEQLRCTGFKGAIEISLVANRLAHLTITLRSMLFGEAKGHLGYAVKDVIGAANVDQFLVTLEKMQTGDRAELTLGNAKLALHAGGKSKIAPEYRVEITWP